MTRRAAAAYTKFRNGSKQTKTPTKKEQPKAKRRFEDEQPDGSRNAEDTQPKTCSFEDDPIFDAFVEIELAREAQTPEGTDVNKALKRNVDHALKIVGPKPKSEEARLQELLDETRTALFRLQLEKGESDVKLKCLGREQAVLDERSEQLAAKIEEVEAELNGLEEEQEEIEIAEMLLERAEAQLDFLNQQREELTKAYKDGKAKITAQLKEWRHEAASLDRDIYWMELYRKQEPVPPGPDQLRFVRARWWNSLLFFTLYCNVSFVLLQFTGPTSSLEFELVLASAYVVEIACALVYYQQMYFENGWQLLHGLLDSAVLVIGIIQVCGAAVLDMRVQKGASLCFWTAVLALLRMLLTASFIRKLVTVDLPITAGERFEQVMLLTVGLNCLTLGFEVAKRDELHWRMVDVVFLFIYTVECVVRWRDNSWKLFWGGDHKEHFFHYKDVVLVLTMTLELFILPSMVSAAQLLGGSTAQLLRIVSNLQVFQALRLLRIFRLIELARHVRPLHVVCLASVEALYGTGWVMVVVVGILLLASVVARAIIIDMDFWHPFVSLEEVANVKRVCATLPDCFFTAFKGMNGDVQEDLANAVVKIPIGRILMIIYIVLMNWILFSTVTAVVCDRMAKVVVEQDLIVAKETEEKSTADKLRRLEELFSKLDSSNNGQITLSEFRRLLRHPDWCAELCSIAGLTKLDLNDLFEILSRQHHGSRGRAHESTETITNEEFLHVLNLESSEVTSQAIMKIEMNLGRIESTLQPFGLVPARLRSTYSFPVGSGSTAAEPASAARQQKAE